MIRIPLSALCFALLLFANSMLWGQTTGATAPEVTQFEPVDTTDLVNLATGDFSYSVPAVVIPGAPGGGYPISLNYHAGILHNQEATWTGLGWNLWPGSVDRSVRGYPDDYKNAPINNETVTGNYHSYSVGLTISGFSVGANYSEYTGFGGSVGFGLKNGASVGVSTDGNGANVSYKTGAVKFDAGSNGVGITLSEPSSNVFSVSAHSSGNVSASLSAGKTGFSLSTKGISTPYFTQSSTPKSYYNGNTRAVTSGGAFSTGGGFVASVDLSWAKTKYITESQTYAYGSIHTSDIRDEAIPNGLDFYHDGIHGEDLDRLAVTGSKRHFGQKYIANDFYFQNFSDLYAEYDANYSNKSGYLSDYMTQNYDNFRVTAQGVGGAARPVIKKRGWIKPDDAMVYADADGSNGSKIVRPYRSVYHKLRTFEDAKNSLTGESVYARYKKLFDQSNEGWIADDGVNMAFVGDQGYLSSTKLYSPESEFGSDHFNQSSEIQNRTQKIRYELGTGGLIERIIVTKEDGVRYIFGVVKVTFGESDKVVYGAAPKIKNETSESFLHDRITRTPEQGAVNHSTTTKNSPYSYAWHLAAIESPDYVDRLSDGYDPNDYGDYVYFEYTEISPDFSWTSPWQSDEESFNFVRTRQSLAHNGSMQYERSDGKKSISVPFRATTKTHVAIFELMSGANRRKDGRSVEANEMVFASTSLSRPKVLGTGRAALDGDEFSFPAGHSLFAIPQGPVIQEGLHPGHAFHDIEITFRNPFADCPVDPTCGEENFSLDPVYLGSTRRGNAVFAVAQPYVGEEYHVYKVVMPFVNGMAGLQSVKLYNGDVFEALQQSRMSKSIYGLDDPTVPGDSENAVSETRFNYSYRLARNTPNSVGELNGQINKGRLTLENVQFYARGQMVNQGYRFDYYNSAQYPVAGVPYRFYSQDPWGYYSNSSSPESPNVETGVLDDTGTPFQAIWSLKSIHSPIGAVINVQYEADRYAWVQNLPAATIDIRLNLFSSWLNESQIDAIIPWGGSLPPTRPDGTFYTPPSLDEVKERLQNYPLPSLSGNEYSHVIVRGYYKVDGNNPNSAVRHRSFVLPISTGFLLDGKGYDDFCKWLVTINFHMARPFELENNPYKLIHIDAAPIESENSTPRQNGPIPVVQLGGGLRVKNLLVKEDIVGNPNVYRQEYFYTDPSTWVNANNEFVPRAGNETGVIMYESGVGHKSDVGDDMRVIRAEEHPYYNFAYGSDVVYQFVSMRYSDQPVEEILGPDKGIQEITTYAFYTARDYQIHSPFSQKPSTPTEMLKNTGVYKEIYAGSFEGDEQLQLTVHTAVHDNGKVVDARLNDFALDTDVRASVVNNSALISQLKSVTKYDSLYPRPRPISIVETTLAAGYNARPTWSQDEDDSPPLIQAYQAENVGSGTMKLNHGVSLRRNGDDLHAQGAFIEKSQALLIAGSNNATNLRGKVLMVNEVTNFFREEKSKATEYAYAPGDDASTPISATVVSESRNLAFDYFTGTPLLTVETSAATDGVKQMYHLSIPAHQLMGLQNRMLDQLMTPIQLTQEGLSLTAKYTGDGELDPLNFLDQLETDANVTVESAMFKHWRPINDRQVGLAPWVNDATYTYVHQTAAKNSTGWRYLPFHASSPETVPSSRVFLPNENGSWLAPGVNTVYDPHLNVVEFKSLNGIYSSAVYIDEGKLVAANFSNAPLSKVAYQGFEDRDDITPLPIDRRVSPKTDTGSVYLGSRSHKGDTYTFQHGLANSQNEFILRFYVKNSADAVTVAGNTIDLNQVEGTNYWVQKVDFNWKMVALTLTGLSGDILFSGLGSECYLDEITLSPDGSGDIASGTYNPPARVSLFGYDLWHRKVNAITDPRGRTIRFTYDPAGNLWQTWDTEGRLKSENYHAPYNTRPLMFSETP